MVEEITMDTVLTVLSVVLTTLIVLALAGIARALRRNDKPTPFGKKLLFFPIFVIGIFLMGGITTVARQYVFDYLKQNVATSISGLVIVIVVTWVLYDWAIWRKR